MKQHNDQSYLLGSQYKGNSALNARIQLHVKFSTNKQGFSNWLFEHINLQPNTEVLELGCGTGGMWLSKAGHIPEGCRITMTDFSSGMLETAKANLSGFNASIAFDVVDAQHIPYEDNRFDVVIANHMLYHVPDRSKALSEIRRVLRPGGMLYASTIGLGHMHELEDICVSVDPRIDVDYDSVAREFGLENGGEQLEQFFDDVQVYYYDDHLIVPEAMPLVEYIMSTADSTPLLQEYGTQALADFIRKELDKNGPMKITKRSGLFVAS